MARINNSIRAILIIKWSLIGVLFGGLSFSSVGYSEDLPYGRLASFKSDGCSHFPNGTSYNSRLWYSCCYQHDLKYWVGGTSQERLAADLALKECVTSKGEFETANLMFEGVRVGGSPFLPTSWRWGFGWAKMRGYTPLTMEELEEVVRLKYLIDRQENYSTYY